MKRIYFDIFILNISARFPLTLSGRRLKIGKRGFGVNQVTQVKLLLKRIMIFKSIQQKISSSHNQYSVILARCSKRRRLSSTQADQPRHSTSKPAFAQHTKITVKQKMSSSHNQYSVSLARCAKRRRLSSIQMHNLTNHYTLYRYSHLQDTRRLPHSKKYVPHTIQIL